MNIKYTERTKQPDGSMKSGIYLLEISHVNKVHSGDGFFCINTNSFNEDKYLNVRVYPVSFIAECKIESPRETCLAAVVFTFGAMKLIPINDLSDSGYELELEGWSVLDYGGYQNLASKFGKAHESLRDFILRDVNAGDYKKINLSISCGLDSMFEECIDNE